jgi:hypothetical protein
MTQTQEVRQDIEPEGSRTTEGSIEPHNERLVTVWSSGREACEVISFQNGTALEHCVARLDPKPSETILDLATGTSTTAKRPILYVLAKAWIDGSLLPGRRCRSLTRLSQLAPNNPPGGRLPVVGSRKVGTTGSAVIAISECHLTGSLAAVGQAN